MNTSAIVMMIVSILLVWGGLIASILFMRANPQVEAMEDPDPVLQDDAGAHPPRGTRHS